MSEHTTSNGESSPSDSDQTEHHGASPTETEDEVWSRRSFVRYLAPISVAVPVIVEGQTLMGLLHQDFGGGQSAWNKPTGVDVGIGGALRPNTSVRAKLSNAALANSSNGRQLTLVVSVKNTANAPAKFGLGAVTTNGGKTVNGGTTTKPLAPGKQTKFRATYNLPNGATPKSVETVVTIGNNPSKKTVKLAPIPGSGG